MKHVQYFRKTLQQYQKVTETTKKVFIEKGAKYGQSWIVARPFSMLEQTWIKILRIRTIQEKNGEQKVVDEPIEKDFFHIINYCVMGILLITDSPSSPYSKKALDQRFVATIKHTTELLMKKNHDYSEAWRNLAISTMVDLMLMKTLRAKNMHANREESAHELLEIFRDILNYAVFCRIRIDEGENPLL